MKVKFTPGDKEIEITPEQTLLSAALENGVEIRSVCRGKLSCTECRIRITEGEANCLRPTAAEESLLGTSWQIEGRRFSCQVRCFGPITVDLTEQIAKQEKSKKNIRGFKNLKSTDKSNAVQDTLILNEGLGTQNITKNK